MMKRISIGLVLILGLLYVSSFVLAADENLLPNGNFEAVGATDMGVEDRDLLYAFEARARNVTDDRWPSDWVIGGKPSKVIPSINGVVKEDAVDGTNSLKLASETNSLRLVASSKPFKIDPSKKYKVSLWVKVLSCLEEQLNDGGWLNVYLGLYESPLEPLKFRMTGVGYKDRGCFNIAGYTILKDIKEGELAPIGEWRELTITFESIVPENAKYVNIMIALEYSIAVILVDNVEVVEVSK